MKKLNPVLDDKNYKALKMNCMICGKSVEGWYASFGEGGTCSRACMLIQDKKPKYGEHTEESFLKKFNLL